MKNVLIVTEKASHARHLKKVLQTEPDNLFIIGVGGHIYTPDEHKYMPNITDADLTPCKRFILSSGEAGFILGEDAINATVKELNVLLSEQNFDVIINACDPDKNGNGLFDYVKSLVHFDETKIKRFNHINFNEEHLREVYHAII